MIRASQLVALTFCEKLQMAIRSWLRPMVFILPLAFAISFYRLGERTLHGDELGSVFEAQRFGLNANSLPYFALLRLWIRLGVNEFWLRSLSALAAVIVVAVTYFWAHKLIGASVARLTTLLLATSPFLVVYAQQIRFYTVGLLGAGLAIWAFLVIAEKKTPRTIAVWIIANALSVAALLMNGLLLLGQGAALFILSRGLRTRVKIYLGVGVIALGIALIGIPAVREYAFNALALYTNAQSRYVASRGWTVAQFAKIPLTIFFFSFGESVYPLTWWLVVPGVLFFTFAGLAGLVWLWQNPRAFWFVVATSSIALTLMYLVFDPLAPPDLQGSAPRYLMFLLPIFYFVIASGVQAKTHWLVVPLLFVNLGSLASYWSGDWAYTDDRVNWKQVTAWVDKFITPDTVLLLDGQAQPLADQYFPSEWNRIWLQPDPDIESSRAIIFSYNWHSEARIQTTNALRQLEDRYAPQAALVQYPLFVYVYDRKSPSSVYQADAAGVVRIPNEIYGIEFQDLRLPFVVQANQRTLNVIGAFGLPRYDGMNVETLRLAQSVRASKIVLFSHFIGSNDVPDGAAIANLRVDTLEQSKQFPLRAGYETSAWNKSCVKGNCHPVYRWHKRIAFVGFQSYPNAWNDFDAAIFESELDLNSPLMIRSLEFERVSSSGRFYVWGILLEP